MLRPAWEVLKSFLPRWGPAVDAIQLNLMEAVEKHRAEDSQYVERFVRSLQRGEAHALVTYLARAAAQSTTEERMRMLAAAAAGVLTPDLSSEMRSRVARAVEQLEPSDVIALREVSGYAASGHGIQQIAGSPENGAALLQTGCLLAGPTGVGFRSKYEMTPLGRAVLHALETWTESPRSPAPPL